MMTELKELEELQNKQIEDILKGTGIVKETYLEYRDKGVDIPEDDAKKLAQYYKLPFRFFLKTPTLIHHGKDNSFGPIYRNSNFFFAKPETAEDLKRLLQ